MSDQIVKVYASQDWVDEKISELSDQLVNLPSGGGFVAQDTEPDDTSVLWIDTSDETEDEDVYYTKSEIDAMMDSYINDIDTLLGGDI